MHLHRILVPALIMIAASFQTTDAHAQSWPLPQWAKRLPVTLTEPNVAARANEYVNVVVDFPAGSFTNLNNEVRVTLADGTVIPSLVHSINGNQAQVTFPVTFARAGVAQVFIYWGNPAATAPSYTFPPIRAAYYAHDNPATFPADANAVAGFATLQAYGKIGITMQQVIGTSAYDPAFARTLRLAGIGAFCVVHSALGGTSVFADVSLWGFTDGNCLTNDFFGVSSASEGATTIPNPTTYISQDFTAGQATTIGCDEAATPDPGSFNELATSNGSCHLRWNGGHTLPNGRRLSYMSFFSGENSAWNADNVRLYRRSLELLLQENRVGVARGAVELGLQALPQLVTTAEDTLAQITLAANNPNNLAITFQIQDQPTNGTLMLVGGTVTYFPAANYSGPDTFSFRVISGNQISEPAPVNITVTPVNDAPVATNTSATTLEDTAVNITLPATDIDSAVLTYAIVTGPTPAQGTVTITGNVARFTPAANYNGPASFTFRASDGSLNSNTATVNITVTPVNDAPVATNATATTLEDTAVNITLPATDVDGDALTFSIVAGPTPTQGTVTITGNIARFVPAANYNGPASFTFRASDGTLNSNTATVNITVTPVNDAPVAVDALATTAEDTAVNITLVATDVDNVALTYSVVNQPVNGTVTITGNIARYTPNANFNGSDTFTFRASDGQLDSAPASVRVTITPVNDAPVATNTSATTAEDTAATIALTATDVDMDPLTYTIVAQPSHGAVSIVNGQALYTPNANYNGPDSFTFRARDGQLDSNVATVSVTVTPVNDAPTVSDATLTLDEDATASVALNAADLDNDPLSAALGQAPANGVVTINGLDVTYAPNADFNGVDSFTVVVSDGNGGSAAATIAVTINPINDAPEALAQTVNVGEDSVANMITLAGADVDGDALTFTVVTQPTSGTLSGTAPDLVYVPNADFNGADSFTFTVNDGTVDSAPATVDITVAAINDAPAFIDPTPVGPLTATEGAALSFGLVAADPDGDMLTFSIANLPAGATLDAANGAFSWTPTFDQEGTVALEFSVSDGSLSDTRTIEVVVSFIDNDGDGLPDAWEVLNGLDPASLDSDGDTISDAFEVGDWRDPIDTDGDGTLDAADTDSDNDGRLDIDEAGDADLATDPIDTDGDGTPDFRQADSDGDGVNDGMDNCPLVANPGQEDLNGDMIGDACQDDRDGDGVKDGMDNCPNAANADQLDTDMDGQGDACDADDDNDGVNDDMDNCPAITNADQLDTDMDGQGDACDTDDDGDMISDDMDNCSLVANADQRDTDMDGQGDACDLDDDGDGINDDVDACPLDSGMGADGCPAPKDKDGVVTGADEGCGCATVENDRKAPASLTGLLGLGLLGLVGWRRRRQS